jgi:C4-dicarboxylate-specific signal transduction histidine kinase
MIKKSIGYATIIVLCIIIVLLGWYQYLAYSIIPHYQRTLTTMAHTRVQEINDYIKKQEKNALFLANERSIIETLMHIPCDHDTHTKIDSLLATAKTRMGFKNIILIDKDATIVYATTAKNIVGIHVNDPAYLQSSLSTSHERASMCLTNDFSYFNYNDFLAEPALFISIPILEQNKYVGILAYQLDPEHIYLITNQYIGLGKTGEIVLAIKEHMNIIFMAPTRNDPDLAFKKRTLSLDQPSIQPSVFGKTGSGTLTDYRDKKVVGAWQFIPKLDWGMLIKIDIDELLLVTQLPCNMLLLLCILFLILFGANIYLWRTRIRHLLHHYNKKTFLQRIPSLLKNPLFILLLIFCVLTAKNIIQCLHERSVTITTAKNKAIKDCTNNADDIETMLAKIAFVGQTIADDLHTNYLLKTDIATRIQRDHKEYPIITAITVLFAPYMYDQKTKIYLQSTENINQTEDLFKTIWYQQAMENNVVWLTNTAHNNKQGPTGTYACTFFDQNNKRQGVIAITFSLEPITQRAQYSGIGQTGYSVIMDADGAFIFHPIKNLTESKTTFMQYAQSHGNEELAAIAQHVMDRKPYLNSYSSEITQDRFWIYTHPIPINNWVIGSLFPESEIALASDTIRHYCFWMIIWATMALLLLGALLWYYDIFSLSLYAFAMIIVFILSLITTWRIIQLTTTVNRESRTIITDQSNLNKFLNDLNEEAARKHESTPINIPCGILLSSLSFADHDSITISGYIWNKYNIEKDKNISRGITLTQATRMTLSSPITVDSDTGEETTTWNIQGTMYHEQDFALFPFDQQQVRIILEHKDLEKNIILTPDLMSYKKISPESTPGLDKDFTLAGFTIEQTFFEYHKINPTTSFGFKEFGKVSDNYQFVFNAIIKRNLSNPFILYLLPLLVILFSLFTTLLIAERKSSPLAILSGYTGLFFALIVLQRSLREQQPAGATLYMEYAFFYTYLTLMLLIIHTILNYYYKTWHAYHNTSVYYMKLLFWPFQLLSWLITTLIIFY